VADRNVCPTIRKGEGPVTWQTIGGAYDKRPGNKLRDGRNALPSLGAVMWLAYFTLTAICFGLASGSFGSVTSSTPSLYVASIFSVCTVTGSSKLRSNVP